MLRFTFVVFVSIELLSRDLIFIRLALSLQLVTVVLDTCCVVNLTLFRDKRTQQII